jgi:S1-C subfamily serine protease
VNARSKLCAVLIAASMASIASGTDTPPPTEAKHDEPVMMDSVSVDAVYSPKQSFGFTMYVRKNNRRGMVHSITVVQVEPGTEAARKGLGPRVRINRINGKAVEDFTASFVAGSELNEVFTNRRDGDRVVLEIAIPGQTETKIVKLVQHAPSNSGPQLPRF